MTLQDAATLRERSREWARTYTALAEALMAEGVPEARARSDASILALTVVMAKDPMTPPNDHPWES